MIYTVEHVALVKDEYVTLNRGDILVGHDTDTNSVVIFRLVNNERDFQWA